MVDVHCLRMQRWCDTCLNAFHRWLSDFFNRNRDRDEFLSAFLVQYAEARIYQSGKSKANIPLRTEIVGGAMASAVQLTVASYRSEFLTNDSHCRRARHAYECDMHHPCVQAETSAYHLSSFVLRAVSLSRVVLSLLVDCCLCIEEKSCSMSLWM